MASGYRRRRCGISTAESPVVAPYMAPSSAIFARVRSPIPDPARRPCSATARYRSCPEPAAARARSCDMAARMRGSTWEASATVSSHPGSARTASRTAAGTCMAPPPWAAQRPVTTPPTAYAAWKRPSRTHSSSQCQPLAVHSRYRCLYSSTGATSSVRRGESAPPPRAHSFSSQARVEDTRTPAAVSPRSRSWGESGLRPGTPRPAAMRWASSCSSCGRSPSRGRGPSRFRSISSWTSRRQGSPSCSISAATSAPWDSAASSSIRRCGCRAPATAASWVASSRASSVAPGLPSCPAPAAGRSKNASWSGGAGRGASPKGSGSRTGTTAAGEYRTPVASSVAAPRRMRWVRPRSQHRPSSTPALRSGG